MKHKTNIYPKRVCVVMVQYFHQILTVVFESLDDSDATIRELALSVVSEMLRYQVYRRSYFVLCLQVSGSSLHNCK